ncbi:uncharacterized protein LOC129294984 [Prosopis cineraria]|uniref:uncharacterized protein LOC129294984 n=1 Tax=Prosopis cineraria TaxID=364024 RepID=UPI0024105236|nr:uncharacterized protein LOC129294984 [Prosopis cineraria]
MAAVDQFGNMHDVALKPSLLRTLLQDHVPDEHRPFSNSSELSKIEYMIKTHSLLSESFTEFMAPKQVESWKSAVDSWVDRILTLVANNMPDKCWAGISLLGITCQECSSSRFLTSYSVWFQKLLPFLLSQEKSHFVRVASCASISDIFARLSAFPDIKRDWSSCAGKVIQPVLDLLNDDNSEAIWEGALHLLCTILTSFPFSIQRHYDSVESAIASKLFSGGCSHNMLKKLAYCLALLPKVRGDAESWSVLMQKIVVVINGQINNAFQGLEEETKQNEIIRLLSLSGKNSPPRLGCCAFDGEATNKATKRSEQSLLPIVSPLMLCCCNMLTDSYSSKVNVPVRLLLALVERVLMVNGSLLQTSLPLMTARQQENVCSELPVLHLHCLELLISIAKGMGRYGCFISSASKGKKNRQC